MSPLPATAKMVCSALPIFLRKFVVLGFGGLPIGYLLKKTHCAKNGLKLATAFVSAFIL
jgi:hypothetical protein